MIELTASNLKLLSEMRRKHLVQTLIRSTKENKILLGRWNRGPFQGRVSGLLGQAESETPQNAAFEVVESLIGADLRKTKSFKMCARFVFHEEDEADGAAQLLGDIYEETQFLLDLELSDDLKVKQQSDEFTPIWFDLDEIPYDEMPEDDVIWYPRVLNGETLAGTFRFHGTRLLDSQIQPVVIPESL